MRGLIHPDEMLKYRVMVVELHDHLYKIPLALDRRRVQTYIRITRSFTVAEADSIASLHFNLKEKLRRNGKEATSI